MLPTTESARPEMSLEWRLAKEAEADKTAGEAVVVAAVVAAVEEEG
jgi:hypothetical protein